MSLGHQLGVDAQAALIQIKVYDDGHQLSSCNAFRGDRGPMYENGAMLAVFLLIYSAVAGRIERSLISGPIVFTAAGFILGADGLGILRIHIDGEGLRLLAELTLAMVLFTDAANADFTIVKRNLDLPKRLLLIGLPLTIVLGFVVAAVVFPRLEILEMALLAVLLAPTDAALGKPVVTNPAVPPAMREALNLESGLNDGICVPIVVLLLGLAVGTQIEGGTVAHVARVVVEAIGIGLIVGLALTWLTTLIQRALGGNSDCRLGGSLLCGSPGGRRQRVYRLLCRRAFAERATRAPQGRAAPRRRTHGRSAGAADLGRVRRHRRRPHVRPHHLASAALRDAEPDRDPNAAGVSVPDWHANEHCRQALHRLVWPARTRHDRFCGPRPRREAARERYDNAGGRLDGTTECHSPRRNGEPLGPENSGTRVDAGGG